MTKQDAVNLYTGLNALGNLSGVKFSYCVAKNLNALRPEIEAIVKAGQAYDQQRIELARKWAKKDAAGEAILRDNQFQLDDTAGFTAALKKLQEKPEYKEYQELLKQPSDFVPHKIKLSDLPETITTTQMNSIIDIVEE